MTPDTIASLAAAISTLAGGSQVWFWYDKKRRDKLLDNIMTDLKSVSDKQIEHGKVFITEDKTRQLLKEYLDKLELSQAETSKDIKHYQEETSKDIKDINNMITKLATQLEIMNAIKDYEKDLNHR